MKHMSLVFHFYNDMRYIKVNPILHTTLFLFLFFSRFFSFYKSMERVWSAAFSLCSQHHSNGISVTGLHKRQGKNRAGQLKALIQDSNGSLHGPQSTGSGRQSCPPLFPRASKLHRKDDTSFQSQVSL